MNFLSEQNRVKRPEKIGSTRPNGITTTLSPGLGDGNLGGDFM
jgi:hypothetical protein